MIPRPLFAPILAVLFFVAAPAAAQSLNFVVIQPGQPGTVQEAQPVMDALGAYVRDKVDAAAAVQGVYINELSQALAVLREASPQWGIVSFPFYARHAEEFAMAPLASSRPGGDEKDRWHLMVPAAEGADWQGLTGTVQGTMLFDPAPAACLLFGRMPGELSFDLEGTRTPLQAVRAVARGKTAGIVVDRLQREAFRVLPAAGELKEIAATAQIPTSPLVWFGKKDERYNRLQEVLLSMAEDPDAADLLLLLQTEGFGPPDPDLGSMRFDDARCPR